MEPQIAFTMPLLNGTDGDRKMSKSFGNHVGLTEPPEEQFGKTMSIPDSLIVEWFRLCTDLDPSEIHRIETGLADGSLHPNEQKRRLARQIVSLYHGEQASRDAEERFNAVFKRDEIPEDIPAFSVKKENVFIEKKPGVILLDHAALLADELNLAKSRSEARRLIDQRGVRLNGTVIDHYEQRFTEPPESLIGSVWQVGRRRFARVDGLS
jgi:tyrosyl-tRNA synthetase